MGRVRWIAPTGLTGLTPLASVGPVAMGPSASGLERTSAVAPEVVVSIDALQSLLQQKVVLSLQAMGTQASLAGQNTPKVCIHKPAFGQPRCVAALDIVMSC